MTPCHYELKLCDARYGAGLRTVPGERKDPNRFSIRVDTSSTSRVVAHPHKTTQSQGHWRVQEALKLAESPFLRAFNELQGSQDFVMTELLCV